MTLKEVLNRGYAKEIYEYALKSSNKDADILTKALLTSKRLPDKYTSSSSHSYEDEDYYASVDFEDESLDFYYYIFARDIEGANISLLQQAIMNSYDEKYIYEFARDVDGANIELLQSKMKYAFPKYIYLFAHDVEDTNIELLQYYLISWIGEGYDISFRKSFFKYLIDFLNNIEGSNVDKAIQYINDFINDYRSNGNIYHHELMDMNMDGYIVELNELLEKLDRIKKRKNDFVKTLKK